MASKRTLEWREKNKDSIKKWQEKMEDLRLRSLSENWDQDKHEMEVVQCILNQKMRDIFIFAKNYIARHRIGKFRNLMAGVYEEIMQYGVVEPSRLNAIYKAIDSFKRRSS